MDDVKRRSNVKDRRAPYKATPPFWKIHGPQPPTTRVYVNANLYHNVLRGRYLTLTLNPKNRERWKSTTSALDPPMKGNPPSERLSCHRLSIRIGPRSGTQDHTVLISVPHSRKWLPADITLHILEQDLCNDRNTAGRTTVPVN
jgi:hypothetical protein